MPMGAAVIGAAAIGAGGSLYAANTQANAAGKGLDFAKSVYAQNAANLSPWITEGQDAIKTLGGIYGSGGITPAGLQAFQSSPDYQFAFTQGLRATDLGAAARGGLQSGGGLKGETEFGQGLATQQFGNYFSHLSDIAKTGLAGASSLAGVSTNLASTVGNMNIAQGQAWGSGTSGVGNSLNSGIQNYLLYQRLQQLGPGGGGPNGASSYIPGTAANGGWSTTTTPEGGGGWGGLSSWMPWNWGGGGGSP